MSCKRYDVQIRIAGEWQWAGIAPEGMTQSQARHLKARMARSLAWQGLGIEAYRVAEVPA